LLAHLLGLATSYGRNGFRLLYLWFEIPGRRGDQHRDEVARFAAAVREGATFESLTYQELFCRVRAASGVDAGDLIRYLTARYFPDV
jgi:hypothetical protein